MTCLIDTNVWSELRNRGRAEGNVRRWAERTDPAELFLSVVTVFELERGVQRVIQFFHGCLGYL